MVKLHTDEEIEKYIQAIKLFNKNIKDLRSFQTVDKVYKNTLSTVQKIPLLLVVFLF